MSTVYERILDRVRTDLGDLETPFEFEFVGDGERNVFNIEHRPLNPNGILLIKDGVTVLDPGFEGVVVDVTNGLVVFSQPPEAGEYWEVYGKKWRYFSDEDLAVFIDTSLAQHTYNRSDNSGGNFTAEDVKPVEEYPIALLSVIQALWALATDASFDIDILAPDGVNIPRSERYRQLMEMIGARQTQYDEIAQALNIGLHSIENFTLRRTAKLTGRLVPVFLPQEYDDGSRPKRVYYPTMLQGTEPIKTGIGTYDHHIVSGRAYSIVVDFEFDLTGCVVKNQIRRNYPQSRTGTVGPAVREFTQTLVDEGAGKMRLSLTAQETRSLPYNAYWEIDVQKPGEEEGSPQLRGMVYATNSEIVR